RPSCNFQLSCVEWIAICKIPRRIYGAYHDLVTICCVADGPSPVVGRYDASRGVSETSHPYYPSARSPDVLNLPTAQHRSRSRGSTRAWRRHRRSRIDHHYPWHALSAESCYGARGRGYRAAGRGGSGDHRGDGWRAQGGVDRG